MDAPVSPFDVHSAALRMAEAESLARKPATNAFAMLPLDEDEPHELDDNPRYLVMRDFVSRFLPDERDVMVYLPDAYLREPERRFPVFYLHDGQNVFDGRTSYVADRTWHAGSTADWLTRDGGMEPTILVGVANTGVRRMAEYTPTRDTRYRGGEGHRYGLLLAEELKPLIDGTFRTLPDPANTAMGGSSLGGLITLALGLEYAHTFGKLAVMSPSVWWNGRSLLNLVSAARPKPELRIWLDMGMSEGLRHLRDCDLLHRRLITQGWHDGKDLAYVRVPGGLHDEDAWAGRFEYVLRFLFPPKL